jgi:hypothetical protein
VLTIPWRRGLTKSEKAEVDEARIYMRAQELDPWPGSETVDPRYEGTSTLAGFKAAAEFGYISAYRWCFGGDDVRRVLSGYGPVVIGINWYASFDDTTSNGVLRYDPDSGLRGGHAICLVGINVKRRDVTGVNSWGASWGRNGRFSMSWDILDALLEQDGDAATVTAS